MVGREKEVENNQVCVHPIKGHAIREKNQTRVRCANHKNTHKCADSTGKRSNLIVCKAEWFYNEPAITGDVSENYDEPEKHRERMGYVPDESDTRERGES
jgi:hypothetical protein